MNDYEVLENGEIISLDRVITRSNGRRHTIKSRVLKYAVSKDGYARVGLMIDGKLVTRKVHRLVAERFCTRSRPDQLEVNHIDGNKLNNHFSNLEWVNRSENMKKAFSVGLSKPLVGEKNPSSKINQETATKIKKRLSDKNSCSAISKDLGISIHIVKDISRGKTWKILN